MNWLWSFLCKQWRDYKRYCHARDLGWGYFGKAFCAAHGAARAERRGDKEEYKRLEAEVEYWVRQSNRFYRITYGK